MSEVTQILRAARCGDSRVIDDLLPLVYHELKVMAATRMAREAAGHTLQPTALVHEAWMRMVKDDEQNWQSRAHFFYAAAEAMRRILIEHARRKCASKRGGKQVLLDISDFDCAASSPDESVLLIDAALEELRQVHAERARVVVLKFFGGLTNEEVAEALGIGERTVYRHWECAKLWLFEKLSAGA